MMKLILSSLFIGILLLIYFIVPKNTAVLTITNSSDVIVTNLEISIRGEPCIRSQLLPKTNTKCTFKVNGDAGYRVLWDGKKAEELGYVTNGMDFQDQLTIYNNGKLNLESVAL
ncbi:hypothetical protein EGC82_09700 [Shewanella livingstonensis]|uniref:Uncharacterized protein n=1 Tax=Shewanella livingstonensis TaxID=150120 RepID=A0A3G8LUE6_9GAMM|nr:hypothetical protein [Shewanella livingstonensis]AZG73014.1 hypothetical protein EGC82_09700 [Shewanella livingstonensis]